MSPQPDHPHPPSPPGDLDEALAGTSKKTAPFIPGIGTESTAVTADATRRIGGYELVE